MAEREHESTRASTNGTIQLYSIKNMLIIIEIQYGIRIYFFLLINAEYNLEMYNVKNSAQTKEKIVV